MRICVGALLAAVSLPAVSQTIQQPGVERLDLATIGRIRDAGINHSHILEYASGLADGVGPRLTGSPELNGASRS
jgi:carboxypeptidase Q